MKEHPILFSDAMVRAILEGPKTQTRRVVKRTKAPECDTLMVRPEAFGPGTEFFMDAANPVRGGTLQCNCPYGVPGDRLWVRETWATRRDVELGSDKAKHYLVYRATHDGDLDGEWHTYGHWRPSIHMPRWASRLTLEVVSVRVERLQDISDADILAEGMTKDSCSEIFERAAGRLEPQESHCVRSDSEDFNDGHLCIACATRVAAKNKKRGAYVMREGCPESDGPAYCDQCQTPLLVSLSEYGIDRELFLENDDPNDVQHFAARGLDAAIAAMIAGGIGDFRDRHIPRLLRIGYATLWDSINGVGSWALNPWVWVVEVKKMERA